MVFEGLHHPEGCHQAGGARGVLPVRRALAGVCSRGADGCATRHCVTPSAGGLVILEGRRVDAVL